MSVTGASGASRATRVEVEPDVATDGAGAATANTTTATRGTATRGRHDVVASLGTSGGGGTSAAGALRPADRAVEIPAYGAVIAKDGSIHPIAGAASAEGPLGVLNAMALRAPDAAAPFDAVTDKALLSKIAGKLAETHAGLAGQAPDDATTLAWRQSRGAALHLLEQAAIRAFALGDKRLGKEIVDKLAAAIQAEPWRQTRDFAFESLVSRAEAKALPSVEAAREAIYPSAPPYEKWLADGKIDMRIYVDDDGSLISDQVDFFKSQGFKHTSNADGSHTLKLAKKGDKPAIEITIPKKPSSDRPALFEKMDDASVDVIGYLGHAGYGHRVDHALASGVGGTGKDKLVFLMQCWGEGNVESLERAYPDAQMLSTTAPTTDNHDWVMLSHMIGGMRDKAGWEDIRKGAVKDLKAEFKDDGEHTAEHWEGHYFFPTTRSTLVKHYDRDGDGVKDGQDHIFNVVYPKRIDAAGGLDPVVQPIPTYALDGMALNKSLNDLSLALRWNHLLPAAEEKKVVWNPDKWRSGGFFEPKDGDLRAFQLTKGADGTVAVALSTRFAHTQQEELSKMLAYEAGLWLGKEAGRDATGQAALGIGLLERVTHQQGAWYASESGMLDEAWAEEALFMKRYGLEGFTFGEMERLAGDPEVYKPEHFKKIADRVKTLPGIAKLADRAPTRVGEELTSRTEITFTPGSYLDEGMLKNALKGLGVTGAYKIQSYAPSSLVQNQPTNIVAVVEKAGKTFQVSLGVDSTGVVKSAARLDLDFAKKAEHTAARILVSLAESGGFPKSEAIGVYEAHRKAGKSFGDALSTTLADLRPRLPPGTAAPDLGELYQLESRGLLSNAEEEKIGRTAARLYPQGTAAEAEKKLFEWVGDVAKRHGLDAKALHKKYLSQFTTGEGGPLARTKGIAAVVAALPKDAGKPEALAAGDLLTAVNRAREGDEASRAGLLTAIREKMGVKDADLAVDAFRASFQGEDAPAGVEEGVAAMKRALTAKKPLADAVEAALLASRKAGNTKMVVESAFDDLGLTSSETAQGKALAAVFARARDRFHGESALAGWATEADPRRDRVAWLALYQKKLDENPRGGPGAAVRALVAEVPRNANLSIGGLERAMVLVPEAERPALMTDLLSTLGRTPVKAARGLLAENVEEGPERTAVLAAFDKKAKAGGTAGESMLAAIETAAYVTPGSVDPEGMLDLLESYNLSTADERKRLAPAFQEAMLRADVEMSLGYMLEGYDSSQPEVTAALEDHRARLARGEPYAEEFIRLLRALPRLTGDDTGVPPARLGEFADVVPEGKRREVADAYLASQRLTPAEFAAKGLFEAGDDGTAEGKRALTAALKAKMPFADAVVAAVDAANAKRDPDNRMTADPQTLDGLVALGFLTADEALGARDRTRCSSGMALPAMERIAASLNGGVQPKAAVLTAVERALAKPGATLTQGIDALLTGLGPRPRGDVRADAPPLSAAHDILQDLPAAARHEVAKRLVERAGYTIEEALRYYLKNEVDAWDRGDPAAAQAIFDREVRKGARAALAAVIREAGGPDMNVDFLRDLGAFGLLSPEDVTALEPVVREALDR